MARVRLRLFAAARQAAGRPVDEFDAGADRTLGDFLLAATQRYGPEFEAILRTSRVWVNGDEPEAGTATVVHDGDDACCRRSPAVPDLVGDRPPPRRVCYRRWARAEPASTSVAAPRPRPAGRACAALGADPGGRCGRRPCFAGRSARHRGPPSRERGHRAVRGRPNDLLHAPGRHRPDQAAGRRAPEERRRAECGRHRPRARGVQGRHADLGAI